MGDDDNWVENTIRPTCSGKKNWLFFGSEEAGTRNATVFTLIQNCRMHGIHPYAYLKDVLEKRVIRTAKLPSNWRCQFANERGGADSVRKS